MEATITNDTPSTTSETEVATEVAEVETGAPKTEDTPATEEAQDTANAEEQNAPENDTNTWSLPISFNHEDMELGRDEAIRLSQLGKHYEENVKGIFDRLDYLAAIRGTNPKDYIEELITATDTIYREELTNDLGEGNPHIEELVELRRNQNMQKYETAKKERTEADNKAREETAKNSNIKIAEQFESLKESFPEYNAITDIPEKVFKAAIKSGDLEKEVLRFHFAEQKKVEKEKQKQVENSKQSTGPVSTSDKEHDNMSAFKRSFWGS
jgi:hypothetical protein